VNSQLGILVWLNVFHDMSTALQIVWA